MSALQESVIEDLVSAARMVNLSEVPVVDGIATLGERAIQNAQGLTMLTKAMVVLDASSGLTASVAQSASTVSVPPETLMQLQNGTEPLAVSFGVYPDTTDEYQAFEAGTDDLIVAGEVISIIITGPDGQPFKGRLPEPIEIELSTKVFDQRNRCVFWDEALNDWSTAGVSLVGMSNQTTRCLTTHLSVFTLILSALSCNNAALIYSEEALVALISTPWAWRPSALVNWGAILLGCHLLRLARKADRQHQNQMKRLRTWAHECKADKEASVSEMLPARGIFQLLATLTQCRSLAHSGIRTGVSYLHSQVIQTKLGVNNAYLDKLQKGVGKTAVHRQAQDEVVSFDRMPGRRQFWILYASFCKWINILAPSWQATSTDRCLLLFAKVFSTWALSAFFYGSTSVAPNQDAECEPQEDFWPKLVQSATVAWVAGVFSSLPLLCLMLAKKACGMNSTAALATFRTFVILYTVFCVLTTCLFLAAWNETFSMC